jgi:hypothetical protein
MADAGGGHFYYVQSPIQLEDLLTGEVGEALETVAREVRVAVEHAEDVQVRLLDAFVVVPHDRGVTSQLGPLTSEQLIELLYEVDLPGRAVGQVSSLRFVVSDADDVLGKPGGVVEFRHSGDAEVEAEAADADVLQRAARRIRMRASERAYAMNFEGRRGEVRREASKALDYLKRLSKQSPTVATLVEELERDVAQAETTMGAMDLKLAYYLGTRGLRGRDPSGKAVKKPT